MIAKITINDTFQNEGIFTYLNNLNVPWRNDITSAILNLDYSGHSGNKRASPLIKNVLGDSDYLSSADVNNLATVAFSLFNVTWTKLYNQLSIEYNPINNYDMTERETLTGTNTGTDAHSGTDTRTLNLTDATTGTDTRTLNLREAHTGSDSTTRSESGSSTTEGSTTTSNTTTDSVYAFNSADWEQNRKSVVSGSGSEDSESTTSSQVSEQLTHGESIANTGTDALQHGESQAHTGTDAYQHGETVTSSGSKSETRTLTRSGNIGVTTTAQMLEGERDLWKWNFIRDVVYRDLDSILTLSTY